METPKSAQKQIRAMRNHTPRLSERKKKLFCTDKMTEFGDNNDEFLDGIEPLSRKKGRKATKNSKDMSIIDSYKKSPRMVSFFETESEEGDTGEDLKTSPSRRSIRLSLKQSPSSSKSETESSHSHKENVPIESAMRKEAREAKQLQKMFTNSMQITTLDQLSMDIGETSSEDEVNIGKIFIPKQCVNKRHSEELHEFSPMQKKAKRATNSLDDVSISTKSFYSAKNKMPPNSCDSRVSSRNLFGFNINTCVTAHLKSKQSVKRSNASPSTSINRGVHHKVRKRTNNLCLGPVNIDQILNNVRNEKLRKLITAKREKNKQIEQIHGIFRKASNPIAMARPLSSLSNHDYSNNNIANENLMQHKSFEIQSTYQTDTDFSDIECGETEDDDCHADNLENTLFEMNKEVIPLISYQTDNALSIKEDISTPVKRKFFKSGRTTNTRKEVHLTDNIKATLTANGKLSIVPEKMKVKKRIKIRTSVHNEFSTEQATVDAILRNLDETGFGDIILNKYEDRNCGEIAIDKIPFSNDEVEHQLTLIPHEEESRPNATEDIVLPDNQDFNEFRKRLPYNTMEPEIIERQHLLLDFLITNNICTEDNFNIFIADPDNHKADAEKIINELVIVVTDNQNTDFRQRIPYNTSDPGVIEQQNNFLDFLLDNNICTEENFDIFIANYSQRKEEANVLLSQHTNNINGQYTETAIETNVNYSANKILGQEDINLCTNKKFTYGNASNIALYEPISQTILPTTTHVPSNICSTHTISQTLENRSEEQQKLFPVFYPSRCQPLPQLFTRYKQQRFWNAGYGSNQYQIDAGQKAFGAHQCKQCGLVYTVHEPEEEKLHRDFHASLHILRFKGWIDEDIVAIYPEWGSDGRILRLTETSSPKRRERLFDILKVVDKELGFSSYIAPKIFVAYFAVRKMQIVGLCLVQPLSKANKYICVNGVDCCSEEQFEAKCGISRIWVSPLHRRFHIGSKLIQAVQLNTIFGEEIQLDKIAFSAPTELGKSFAQKITKNDNFLVYQ